jgi:hypothetical protein
MARIRTIKPEFFTSEDIVSMTPLARLFYVALWCEADRDGRMEWKPGTLKLRYLPGDTCSITELAEELAGRGLIVLYEVNGKPYAQIPSFSKHQVINNRESPSTLPPRVTHASPTREPRVQAEGKEGRKGKEGDSTEPQSDSPPASTLPLVDGTDYPITQEQLSEWQESFPAVDVEQQLRGMRAWCKANPAQRKTSRGVSAFVVRWLAKEQDKGGSRAPAAKQQETFV